MKTRWRCRRREWHTRVWRRFSFSPSMEGCHIAIDQNTDDYSQDYHYQNMEVSQSSHALMSWPSLHATEVGYCYAGARDWMLSLRHCRMSSILAEYFRRIAAAIIVFSLRSSDIRIAADAFLLFSSPIFDMEFTDATYLLFHGDIGFRHLHEAYALMSHSRELTSYFSRHAITSIMPNIFRRCHAILIIACWVGWIRHWLPRYIGFSLQLCRFHATLRRQPFTTLLVTTLPLR